MNECPFCGGTLNCNNDDIWYCNHCHETWIRVTTELLNRIKEFETLYKER